MADQRSAPPCVLVVFGASGDLTARKLLPAIGALHERGLLNECFTVVGVARTEMDDADFRDRTLEAVPDAGPGWRDVVARFRYVPGDYGDPATFEQVAKTLSALDDEVGCAGNRVYYLATPPGVFSTIAAGLGANGLQRPGPGGEFARIVVEKPFGRDLASAVELNRCLHGVFDESQVYRIDHYLGKETVQNVLALRFANAIFEPLWNRRYVDSVEITVAESAGIGHRGSFYERAGALRDIVQNHVLQVLSLVAMEPPTNMDPEGIRDEKVKALRAVDMLSPDEVANEVVRGQYGAGEIDGESVPGYCEEEGVDPQSTTETYVAMRLHIDNWRWAGVPFYVRTGKRLEKRVTDVSLLFHRVPHLPFSSNLARDLRPNQLLLRIQPDEGVTLKFGAKVPGSLFEVRTVDMDFSYDEEFGAEPPEAYERLLLDAMIGDPTLFIRTDEVEQAWRLVEPVLEAWEDGGTPLERYPAGSWGPRGADRLLERDGHRWRTP